MNDQPDQRRDPQSLAEARTDWAEDRTLLANERTFAAWVRTALGAIGVAIGLHAVFRSPETVMAGKLGAAIFIVLSFAIVLSARSTINTTLSRLHAHTAVPVTRGKLNVVTITFCVAAAVVAVAIGLT